MISDPDRTGLICEVTDRQSVVRAWLPDITPEQVRVALHGDRLTIWSTAPSRDASSDTFCHSVRIPNPVNLARATIQYQDGELTVTLPHTRGRIRLPGEAARGTGAQSASGQHSRQSSIALTAAALPS
jgi:hypothetical protein